MSVGEKNSRISPSRRPWNTPARNSKHLPHVPFCLQEGIGTTRDETLGRVVRHETAAELRRDEAHGGAPAPGVGL